MTREEMENCIVDTLFECTHSGEDDTISDKEFAKVLVDKFINHETELLKEFVEFVKQSWQEEINTYESLQKGEDCPYIAREAIKSKLIGMRKMLGLLEHDLEEFLEEQVNLVKEEK